MIFSTFGDFPIARKLTYIIMLVCTTALLGASSVYMVSEVIRFRHALVEHGEVLTGLLGITTAAALVFEDQPMAQRLLGALTAEPQVNAAALYTSGNQRLADYPAGKRLSYSEPVEMDSWWQAGIVSKQRIYRYHDDHLDFLMPVYHRDEHVGHLYLQIGLAGLYQRILDYIGMMAGVMAFTLAVAIWLSRRLQRRVSDPIMDLCQTVREVSLQNNYRLRATPGGMDEVGGLIEGFNAMLERIEQRDHEINHLNERLNMENQRMGAELDVTRRLQQMILPSPEELEKIKELDIAGFMEPANEVGGDYYDVLDYGGRIKIGIGDITGHGLESGVLMLMVQTAVRTLMLNQVNDPKIFSAVVNQVVYDNVRRMGSDKNLTLALLDYHENVVTLSGQHEEVLVVRKGGVVERVDTLELGFMLGVEADITPFLHEARIQLESGDGLVLYTDGITEAMNLERVQYSIERLCGVVSEHWRHSAAEIQQAIIRDLRLHVADRGFLDDVTLLVVKQQ